MLRYKSGSTGEEIKLSGGNVRAHIKTAGLYDYEWEPEEVRFLLKSEVEGFGKKPAIYKMLIDFCGNQDEREMAAEKFYGITERDVIEMKPGTLYFKDMYIKCFVIGTNYEENKNPRVVQIATTIYAPSQFWITEVEKEFYAVEESKKNNYLDYEYDHNYDYTSSDTGDVIWNVDHYAACEFEMNIFGPVIEPRIKINGHTYEVYTSLGENEYLKIDSRENAVIKYLENGTREDMYDFRAKEESIFEPIKPGDVRVVWPGNFGFNIKLFCERSAPRWKMKNS